MLDVIRAHCPLVNGEGCERGQNAGLLDLEIVQWWNDNSDEKLKNWKILARQRKLLQTVTMCFNVDSALILVEVIGTVGNWNNAIARLPSPWLALTHRGKEVEPAVEFVYILTHKTETTSPQHRWHQWQHTTETSLFTLHCLSTDCILHVLLVDYNEGLAGQAEELYDKQLYFRCTNPLKSVFLPRMSPKICQNSRVSRTCVLHATVGQPSVTTQFCSDMICKVNIYHSNPFDVFPQQPWAKLHLTKSCSGELDVIVHTTSNKHWSCCVNNVSRGVTPGCPQQEVSPPSALILRLIDNKP